MAIQQDIEQGLVADILDLEWDMFQEVRGLDGPAPCQQDRRTFEIMRSSQVLSWNQETAESYLDDLQRARAGDRNLMTEKYARMMESTSPCECRGVGAVLPALDEPTGRLVERLGGLSVRWMEEAAAKYPHVCARGRPIRASEDGRFTTSFETYNRAELATYSRKTLQLSGRALSGPRRGGDEPGRGDPGAYRWRRTASPPSPRLRPGSRPIHPATGREVSKPMIKTIIIHHLPDMNDLPAAERWFYRYHIPEVLRNQPVSYVSFRAVPPPPGAEEFGYCNYKVHENLNRGEGEKPLGLLTMTKEVVPLKVIMVNVPAGPTEDFLGRGASFEEKTILRWLVAIRYPRGVSVEEGDDWYLNVHAKEVHAAAGDHPLLQLQGHRSAGGHGQGRSRVHASPVCGVVRLAPRHRAVVREQQRLGGFEPHQPAAVHQTPLGYTRQLPLRGAGSRFRQHLHPGAAQRRLVERGAALLRVRGRCRGGGHRLLARRTRRDSLATRPAPRPPGPPAQQHDDGGDQGGPDDERVQ